MHLGSGNAIGSTRHRAKTNANLEKITQIEKPRRKDLVATRPKLVGCFDTHKVNEALKVDAYLNKDPYMAKLIGHSLVAIYKKFADRPRQILFFVFLFFPAR